MKFTDQKFRWIAFSIGLSVFIYVLSRAIHLSITHDEVGTLDVLQIPVWDVMFSERCFQSANNHVLNSLLMKMSAALFGTSEWALRLPNVLSYILFFAGTYIVVYSSTKDNVLRLCGLILLNSVLYQLDFFSLARGYGLANAFEMFSIAMMVCYLQNNKKLHMLYSFLFASLAVYANFTWLLFFAALWGSFNLMVYLKEERKRDFIFKCLQINVIPACFAVLLTLLCYKPISILGQQDEFRWGAKSLLESLKTFSNDFLYKTEQNISPYIQLSIIVIIVLAFLTSILFLLLKKLNNNEVFILFASLIAMIMLATICQHQLLHTMYIDGRKATLYFSLLMGILFLLLVQLKTITLIGSYIASGFLIILGIWHFFAYKNNQCVREWWFDANAKQVAKYIATHPLHGNYNTAIHWKFYPAILYYNQFTYDTCINELVKLDEIQTGQNFAYYYVEGDEIRNVPLMYSPIGRAGDGILLKKDSANYLMSLHKMGEDSLLFLRKNINWSELSDLKLK